MKLRIGNLELLPNLLSGMIGELPEIPKVNCQATDSFQQSVAKLRPGWLRHHIVNRPATWDKDVWPLLWAWR